MENQEGICMVCLKICNRFKSIEGNIRNALDKCMPKINPAAIRDPVMCTSCSEMLIKCFDFKSACFYTHNYIVSFAINKDDKLDLRDVYLSKNENNNALPEDQNICGFCMNPINSCSVFPVNVETVDIMLENMIKQCLPELDLTIIKAPVICETCHESLKKCFSFVTKCLITEEKIKEYRETLDLSGKDQVELSSLLQFAIEDATTSEVDGNVVDLIKVEKQEEEYAKDRENGNELGVFKSEQMFWDGNENVKEEDDNENESSMVMDDLKFNNMKQFKLKKMFVCTEESNNLDVIKIEDSSCEEDDHEENLVEMEDRNFLLNERIAIKLDEVDTVRYQLDLNTELRRKWKSLIPRLGGDISEPRINHTSTNANAKKTKYQQDIRNHCQQPKDLNPSEKTVYKCSICAYQSKYEGYYKMHLETHSALIIYQCKSCPYRTRFKVKFREHVLLHKNLFGGKTCNSPSCPCQPKIIFSSETYPKVHRSKSPKVKMYNCDSCSFNTDYEYHYNEHLLSHQDSIKSAIYHCDAQTKSDPYQTKCKETFIQHNKLHKDIIEVTTYDYPYQTGSKSKSGCKAYLKVHNPLEVNMYKCDYCSFQTKHKYNVNRHLLTHNQNSAKTVYKCDSCPFQTIYERRLIRHNEIHEDLLKITTYNCDCCPYQTKDKCQFKTHLHTHRAQKYSCKILKILPKKT